MCTDPSTRFQLCYCCLSNRLPFDGLLADGGFMCLRTPRADKYMKTLPPFVFYRSTFFFLSVATLTVLRVVELYANAIDVLEQQNRLQGVIHIYVSVCVFDGGGERHHCHFCYGAVTVRYITWNFAIVAC